MKCNKTRCICTHTCSVCDFHTRTESSSSWGFVSFTIRLFSVPRRLPGPAGVGSLTDPLLHFSLSFLYYCSWNIFTTKLTLGSLTFSHLKSSSPTNRPSSHTSSYETSGQIRSREALTGAGWFEWTCTFLSWPFTPKSSKAKCVRLCSVLVLEKTFVQFFY